MVEKKTAEISSSAVKIFRDVAGKIVYNDFFHSAKFGEKLTVIAGVIITRENKS